MSVAEPLPIPPQPRSEPDRLRADLALAFVCLIWGSTFVIVKTAIADVSTLLFLGLRFGIAVLTLALVFALGRRTDVFSRGPVLGGILAGCCLFGGYFLQTEGLRYTTPGKSGFLTGLYIVLVPLLSAAVYRRVPQMSEWIGVALATAGLMLMSFRGESLQINIGDVLTIGCAVLYAVHILLLGRYSPTMAVERLTLLQMVTCAVLGFATCWWVEPVHFVARPATLAAVIGMGVLGTALAFTIQTWGQKYTTTTRTAVIFSLEPVFALATSYAAGADVPGVRPVLGAAAILAGILVVELKPIERRPHQLLMSPSPETERHL